MYCNLRNTVRWVSISPTDRLRCIVVASNVAKNFASQISDRRKDSATEDVPFNFGEPEFDLVQPGRIRRGEMQVHAGMGGEERPHLLGLMGRQVVEDDVDLASAGLHVDHL